ncbi:MAG: cupin domain-containing protein, partial [Proteobacteria bacterium]|nr:cupin domain-containing protein [Pseudomonadota bacterium]
MKTLAPQRRIVTGVNAAGRSYIAQDGVSPAMLTLEGREGYRNNNLWRTLGAQAPVDAPDTVTEHVGVLPPPGGTVIRVIDIPPEAVDPEERRRATDAVFKAMFADADHHAGHARHPGMHTTDTIDYAILL